MAFYCKMADDLIYSFKYSLKDWIALKENKTLDFRMGCCNTKAVLKTSKIGTQFFAHKAKPKDKECATGGETPEHIHIKYLVSKKLFECGWHVEVEKRGVCSQGNEWVADIYAEKGKAKIVIEVQWSKQSYIETKRRQQIYKDSGIRCAWLLRSGSLKDRNAITGDYLYMTKEIPVFSIYKKKKEENPLGIYEVYSADNGLRGISVEDFVGLLASAKISFVPKYNPYLELRLSIVKKECWKCSKPTNIVYSLDYEDLLYSACSNKDKCNIGKHGFYRRNGLGRLGLNKKDADFINLNFARRYNFSPLKRMYSKSFNRSYIANSCIHCNALIGQEYIGKYVREKLSEVYHSDVADSDFTTTEAVKVYKHDNAENYELRHDDYSIGKWVLNCDK